jgi:preprotein translocase subunit SecE
MTTTPETEATPSRWDTPLLWLAIAVLAGSIGAFYYLEGQAATWMRWVGMVAGAVVSVVIASRTETGRVILSYRQGAMIELRRVVWPSRRETMQTTLLIVVVVMVLAVFLWGVDAVLIWAVRTLTGREV